jgi:GNAT superfamily N-acetyltransferase
LLGQLGYPTTAAQVAARFARVAGSSVDAAWVAEVDGVVVGFASAHLLLPFELDGPLAELTALVVDGSHRGSGAGRALVDACETWAADAGAVRLSVATAFRRVEAHAFYERLGFEQLAKKYQKTPESRQSSG